MAAMIWVWISAVLIVVLVGAAVLPRRASRPRRGFPWFWILFPTAAFLVAGSLHMWLPAFGEPGGWMRYVPLANRQAVIRVVGAEHVRAGRRLTSRTEATSGPARRGCRLGG